MTFAEFHNALRILLNIDMHTLVAAGALSDDDTAGWQAFHDSPWRWFIRAADDEAKAVWRIIEARQPQKEADLNVQAIRVALGFGGGMDEENIGWRGTYPPPSTDSHFRCEFCHAEHTDCTLIPHDGDCPVMLLRGAS